MCFVAHLRHSKAAQGWLRWLSDKLGLHCKFHSKRMSYVLQEEGKHTHAHTSQQDALWLSSQMASGMIPPADCHSGL